MNERAMFESENLQPVLRQATMDDCELMFRLQHLDGRKLAEEDQIELSDYRQKFNPQEIQVIEINGEAVGRLRVVRDNDIYIGGLQILPNYRNHGIGTKILKNLMIEAKRKDVSVKLHVFHKNIRALELYERLGFKVVSEDIEKKMMILNPAI